MPKMKSKKEIEKCIKKLKLVRTGIPHRSMFGDDNWGSIDKQVETLELALKKDESSLQDRLDDIFDRYDGDFPPENTLDSWEVDALDWVLNNNEDELISDGDIKVFCKKGD